MSSMNLKQIHTTVWSALLCTPPLPPPFWRNGKKPIRQSSFDAMDQLDLSFQILLIFYLCKSCWPIPGSDGW